MKPSFNPLLRTESLLPSTLPVATAFMILMISSALGASDSWITGTSGAYANPDNWSGGNVPNGATDIATIEGANSIVEFNDTVSLQALNLALSATGATPTFNQAGGSLTLGTLAFGGAGGTRNPTYNMGGGTLNISTSFSWSNGNNARFNQSAGTVHHGGGFMSIGVGNGSRGHITMTGGTFNANSVSQLNLGNTGSGNGQGNINLSGAAIFNATTATLVVGQLGAATGSNSFGTLTLADTSALNASTIVVGGNNAASSVFGVINLNGGTISAGSIRKGSSNIASSITQNVLHANGGTVRALTHANNANYFQNLFVDLQSGGLNFDTNGNSVTISSVLSGTGGLAKAGIGTLSITNGSNTYEGDTTVTSGMLTMSQTTLDDDSTVSVGLGAILNLSHGGQDQVAEIVLNGESFTTAGTYGSTSSPAIFQNDDFFDGNGVLRIGPLSPGLDLMWTGAADAIWDPLGLQNFTTNGIDAVAFNYNDNVTFDDSSSVTTVYLSGLLHPGGVTFNGTQNYSLISISSPSGISGEGGIIVNNTASVSLGGPNSAFTGPIAVNAGVLIALDDKSFGATSGITIANGAQVNLNGKSPGAIHTYTLNGTGPGGQGAIVNNTLTDVFSSGGVKHLILNADSTIGSEGGRFDIGGGGGTITGNGHTLTKVGGNLMAFRGSMDPGNDSIGIVVAGGAIWAEGSATAFGGSNGNLTIQSGAAAGTFGSNLAIETPVTVEDGGILRSGTFEAVSANTGTWTNSITLNGDVTLSGLGGRLVLSGSTSGTANVTKSGANEVTISNPGYTGNTTVAAGTLTVGGAGLDDEGEIVIAAGAILNLSHDATDVVDTLLLGGVPAAPGTWGSPTSDADNKNDVYFQGDGILDVRNTAVVPSGYATWIAAFPLEGDDTLPGSDPDHDGLQNAVERVIGGNPSISSQQGRPTGAIDGTDLVFTFNREDASETADTLVEVEYGNDLAGWTAVTIGAASEGIVKVEENDGDPDLITVSIPLDGDTERFARLKVTVTSD